MSIGCSASGCNAPDVACSQGEFNHEDCLHWQAAVRPVSGAEEVNGVAATGGEFRFPWTGNAMGPTDLPYLAGASRTKLVTMAGAAEAGKTSLLAAFYLLLARGIRPQGVEFAGSLTLEGWENISSHLRWSTKHGPSFPPHTSSGSGRSPGMLHLSLQAETGLCELTAADAPGEWFADWTSNKMSTQAEGARWLADCSDIFLVIADSQALAGPQRGQARGATIDLLRRVGGELQGRPAALVWTKSDIHVPEEIEAAVREAAKRSLVNHAEFRVSMHPTPESQSQNQGHGILELLQWVMAASPRYFTLQVDEKPERALFHKYGQFS